MIKIKGPITFGKGRQAPDEIKKVVMDKLGFKSVKKSKKPVFAKKKKV